MSLKCGGRGESTYLGTGGPGRCRWSDAAFGSRSPDVSMQMGLLSRTWTSRQFDRCSPTFGLRRSGCLCCFHQRLRQSGA